MNINENSKTITSQSIDKEAGPDDRIENGVDDKLIGDDCLIANFMIDVDEKKSMKTQLPY